MTHEPEAAARAEIARLIFEYARRQDAADFDGVGELFAHAAFQATAGAEWRGRELAERRRANVVLRADGSVGTRHLTTNLQIEIDGSGDLAVARSYFSILRAALSATDGGIDAIGAGRYLDRFERVDGVWRFAHRRALLDLPGAMTEHRRVAAADRGAAMVETSALPPLRLPLAAAAAIEALLFRYAERIDLGDFDGVGALLAASTFSGDHGEVRGGPALARGLREGIRLYDGSPRTKHVTTNVEIDIDEAAGSAQARSCWALHQQTPDLPLQVIAAGRYLDAFERLDSGPQSWRFVERRIVLEQRGDLSHHIPAAGDA